MRLSVAFIAFPHRRSSRSFSFSPTEERNNLLVDDDDDDDEDNDSKEEKNNSRPLSEESFGQEKPSPMTTEQCELIGRASN